MTSYATLAQLQAEVKAIPTEPVDDAYLLRAAYWLSARVDKERYSFAPFIETRYFDSVGDHINDVYQDLYVDYPLLELTSVSVSGSVITDVITIPRNQYPREALRRTPYAYTWWGSWYPSADWRDAVAVTGIWGYNSGYPTAWLASGETVSGGGLTANATTYTAANVGGADGLGRIPRFSPGNLLRIDSEFIEVVSITGNVLTLLRGVNGSTAAAHTAGAVISTWQPEDNITRAVVRGASYMHSRRGSFVRSVYDGVGTSEFPDDMPQEFISLVRLYPLWEGFAAV